MIYLAEVSKNNSLQWIILLCRLSRGTTVLHLFTDLQDMSGGPPGPRLQCLMSTGKGESKRWRCFQRLMLISLSRYGVTNIPARSNSYKVKPFNKRWKNLNMLIMIPIRLYIANFLFSSSIILFHDDDDNIWCFGWQN